MRLDSRSETSRDASPDGRRFAPNSRSSWCVDLSRWRFLFLITLMTIATTTTHANGQSGNNTVDPMKEYNVKAAYLYSFGRYVTWPAGTWQSDDQPFVIGVIGESRILVVLTQIAQTRKIGGRAIQVRKLDSIGVAQDCQIVFVSKELDADAQRSIILSRPTASVLLVGESPGFAHAGGVVNFEIADDVVRFQINVDAAQNKRISVDAKLLRVAELVAGRAPDGGALVESP